eukprot:g4087.t1
MNKTKILLSGIFLILGPLTPAAPVELVNQAPVEISTLQDDTLLIDFDRVSFGNLLLTPPPGARGEITVHFGEASTGERIDRKPPGTVRYAKTTVTMDGAKPLAVAPAADRRNTVSMSPRHPVPILTPEEWGVILPFRWVEIEGWPGQPSADQITRKTAFSATWDDEAASFRSSDELLNRIWDLCRYSIKATTFAGVYVDGDRERIPYEADAYINQICHYYTDNDFLFARDTFDHLMQYSTWPTEWAFHMVMVAHADWMQTADAGWLRPRYEALKPKLLLDRMGEDGLLHTPPAHIKHDIVDWPAGERDGYVFTPVNTVVNAFFIHALNRMAELAEALGETGDAERYRKLSTRANDRFQRILFDETSGLYRDGIGTAHSSIHANFIPLAFGLVPAARRPAIVQWLETRGMRCSVYAAQYLMDALFQNNAADAAIAMATAETDRSWRHMVESGTTITWEAWDMKYKPNQDWNHAWGAAPANLFPRYILGAEAVEPGWKTAVIRPQPAGLRYAGGKIPTPRGPILIEWNREKTFQISIRLPTGISARVDLPAPPSSTGVFRDGKQVPATRLADRWILDGEIEGSAKFETDQLKRILDTGEDKNALREFLKEHPAFLLDALCFRDRPTRIMEGFPIGDDEGPDFIILLPSSSAVEIRLVKLTAPRTPVPGRDGNLSPEASGAALLVEGWSDFIGKNQLQFLRDIERQALREGIGKRRSEPVSCLAGWPIHHPIMTLHFSFDIIMGRGVTPEPIDLANGNTISFTSFERLVAANQKH